MAIYFKYLWMFCSKHSKTYNMFSQILIHSVYLFFSKHHQTIIKQCWPTLLWDELSCCTFKAHSRFLFLAGMCLLQK